LGEKDLDLREISRAALVCATGLALPLVFHAFHLGHVFLPMYLPLLAGAFLLRPRTATAVAFVTPLVSAAATGMPPLFPPVAAWMAVELGLMAGLAGLLHRQHRLPPWAIVAIVLVAGRGFYALLAYGTGLWLELPARALTLTSQLAGWPGMLLALVVVPTSVRLLERTRRLA
jgi:predicted ABC-type sugar transport system permease subunit